MIHRSLRCQGQDAEPCILDGQGEEPVKFGWNFICVKQGGDKLGLYDAVQHSILLWVHINDPLLIGPFVLKGPAEASVNHLRVPPDHGQEFANGFHPPQHLFCDIVVMAFPNVPPK
eukprot:13442164-Ditylum_brightwellii.AAC.1